MAAPKAAGVTTGERRFATLKGQVRNLQWTGTRPIANRR